MAAVLRVHLAKHAVVFHVVVSGVGFIIGAFVVFHVHVALSAVVLVFGWKWRDWRDVHRHAGRAALGCAVAATQKPDSSRQILWVFITPVAVSIRRVGGYWTAVARGAPLTVVGKAVFIVRSTFREDRLVRTRVDAAVVAETFTVPVRRIALRWRRCLGRAHLLVTHVRRGRSRRGRRIITVITAILVHGNQDRSGLKQLNLLMLRDEQLGGVLPLRSMLPT